MTANTENYFFSANNIEIDSNSGKFTDESGLIGIKDGSSLKSDLVGYFSSQSAKGVHGVTYTDLERNDGYLGVFYGNR